MDTKAKIEILSPSGTTEAVFAAVQNGADGVYMGFGSFNARRNAKNFTEEQMREAIEYCHARGVKVYITMNTVIYDREAEAYLKDIKALSEMGADAVIVQDFGAVRLIKKVAPDLEIHGSTQMSVHNLDGAIMAKKMGVSRIVLSRELSFDEIEFITKNCGIETEVFVHGALCMCYSGQCYMSGMLGGRSGNRGLCAGTCRLPFAYDGGKTGYPLSLKDLSLVSYVQKLKEAGVACLKIEGRMKRAEYVGIVTKIFKRLSNEGGLPTAKEQTDLRDIFSRDGFTEGYFLGKKGPNMFGVKTDVPLEAVKDRYDEIAQTFANGKENPLVEISFKFRAVDGEGIALETFDLDGNSVSLIGEKPQIALKRSTTSEEIEKSLRKTGGTPFFVGALEIDIQDGLMIPLKEINALRRDALETLLENRKNIGKTPRFNDDREEFKSEDTKFYGFTISVTKLYQVTDKMLENPPETLYIPLMEAYRNLEKFKDVVSSKAKIVLTIPRIFTTFETEEIETALLETKKLGISTVLCTNIGHIELAKRLGFEFYCDFGFNITNENALMELTELGSMRSTLSFELKFPQIRDITKVSQTEIIVYGYLPLMVFEVCAIKRKTGKCTCKNGTTYLTDRKNQSFALLAEFGCRNTLYNSKPLYLADKSEDFKSIGVNFARLAFTTEKPTEIDRIIEAYTGGDTGGILDFTRGLYYRGVI